MLGKVKQWLGIEGVKLELILPEEVDKSSGLLRGQLRFQSMQAQTVTRIKVALIERYSRGKGEDKLIDEYEMGSFTSDQQIEVPANEVVELDFSLPFTYYQSEIDEIEVQNLLFKGLAKVAKRLRNVRSEYRLEAEARVKGVALNPFDKKILYLK